MLSIVDIGTGTLVPLCLVRVFGFVFSTTRGCSRYKEHAPPEEEARVGEGEG